MRLAILGIKAIFKAGFLPSALELADEFTLRAVKKDLATNVSRVVAVI